jgi:hypothetical protein
VVTFDGVEREVTTQLMWETTFVETVLDVTLGDVQRFPIGHSEFRETVACAELHGGGLAEQAVDTSAV